MLWLQNPDHPKPWSQPVPTPSWTPQAAGDIGPNLIIHHGADN